MAVPGNLTVWDELKICGDLKICGELEISGELEIWGGLKVWVELKVWGESRLSCDRGAIKEIMSDALARALVSTQTIGQVVEESITSSMRALCRRLTAAWFATEGARVLAKANDSWKRMRSPIRQPPL